MRVIDVEPIIEILQCCIAPGKRYDYDVSEYEAILRDIETQPIIETFKEVQPVDIEPLTDREQRIFLAAMGREEQICKHVDSQCRNCREPYEDSLVSVCHEIIRKVKGELWQI